MKRRCAVILVLFLWVVAPAGAEALVEGWLPFNIVDGDKICTNVVRFDGSGQQTIHEADGLIDTSLSADGRSIIGSRIGPTSTIVTLRLDGGAARSVCSIDGYAFSPSWAPDMKSITFCLVNGGLPRVYVMTADGKDVRPVSDAGTMSPHWSSDGKKLAYVKFSADGGKGEIKLANVKTGAHVTLLQSDAPITDVAWSPGDKRLAYIQKGPDGAQVFIVNADATEPTPVTSTQGVRSGLRFSLDGRTLYYSRAERNGQQSTLMSLTPGGEEKPFMRAAPGQYIMMSGGLLMFWPTIKKK